uniref:Uncharacterized protein n=1 Tax=Glossina austeni TaxID=7395 RepID=A0A1A9UNA2_GLOAU
MYCNWDFRHKCCAPTMQDPCDTFCDCQSMDYSRCCYPCPPSCPVPCPSPPSCRTTIYPQQIVKEYMEKTKNGARKLPSIALRSKTEVVNKQLGDVRKPKLRSETSKEERTSRTTRRDKRAEVAKKSEAPSEPIPPKLRPFSEKFTRRINGGTKHQEAAKRKGSQETTADREEFTICKCPQQPIINIVKCKIKCKSESNKTVSQTQNKVSQKYVQKSRPEKIAQAEETDSDSDSAYKDTEEYHDSADSEGFAQNGDSEELSPPQRERTKRDSENVRSCTVQEYSRAEAGCCVCLEKFLEKRPEKPIEKSAEKSVESPEQKHQPKRSGPRPCTCCTCSTGQCSQPVKVIVLVFRPTSENKKLCKNTDAEVMDFRCIQSATVLRNLINENCDSDSDSKLVELSQASSDCSDCEKLLCTCQFKDRKNFAKNGHKLDRNGKFQSRALGGAELSDQSYEENNCDDYLHLQRPISQRSSSLIYDLYVAKKDNDLESDRLLAGCSMSSKISLSEDYICHSLHEEVKDYYLRDRSLEKLDFPEILKSYDSNSQSSNILKLWFALNNDEPAEVLWTKFKSPLSSHISITTRPSLITRYWSAFKIDFHQKWDTVWEHMRAYRYGNI